MALAVEGERTARLVGLAFDPTCACRCGAEGAEEPYETLKQLWIVLGVSCCRKAARLVLGEEGRGACFPRVSWMPWATPCAIERDGSLG